MARALLLSLVMGEDDKFDSTLIRHGRNAVSFAEMETFVHTLETRPLAKLLEELPDLARLSEAKFALAVRILRIRFKSEAPINQRQLRMLANEIATAVKEASVATRIRAMFV